MAENAQYGLDPEDKNILVCLQNTYNLACGLVGGSELSNAETHGVNNVYVSPHAPDFCYHSHGHGAVDLK